MPASGGTGGSAGAPGSAGVTGSGGSAGSGGSSSLVDAGTDSACLVSQIPTVYLLVDRSSSMFHCLTGNTGGAVCADMTNTSWYNLKIAIESVVSQLDSKVRFGFATIFGTNPSGGGMCPSLQGMLTDNVAPALNNAATIKTLYDSLPFPPNSTQSGAKFEAPTSESLGVVANALLADTNPGARYILFVTDGQPDYCDDSNTLRP